MGAVKTMLDVGRLPGCGAGCGGLPVFWQAIVEYPWAVG